MAPKAAQNTAVSGPLIHDFFITDHHHTFHPKKKERDIMSNNNAVEKAVTTAEIIAEAVAPFHGVAHYDTEARKLMVPEWMTVDPEAKIPEFLLQTYEMFRKDSEVKGKLEAWEVAFEYVKGSETSHDFRDCRFVALAPFNGPNGEKYAIVVPDNPRDIKPLEYRCDEYGNLLDKEGAIIVQSMNEDGTPALDDDGAPIFVRQDDGELAVPYRWRNPESRPDTESKVLIPFSALNACEGTDFVAKRFTELTRTLDSMAKKAKGSGSGKRGRKAKALPPSASLLAAMKASVKG